MVQFGDEGHLRQHGFDGFSTVAELQVSRCKEVPSEPGIYLIIRPVGEPPVFLEESIGGHFKARNPTVPVLKLSEKWVELASVLYIGKAGVLKTRLKQYMDYGLGQRVAHHGGRYIWQLAEPNRLQVCWKATPHQDPAAMESAFIQTFRRQYNQLPFANLRH